MGSVEDRATLAEHARIARASAVAEIMVPGHGIWTREGLKELQDARKRTVENQADEELRFHLHYQHPGRWGDHASLSRMRRDIQREREEDEHR